MIALGVREVATCAQVAVFTGVFVLKIGLPCRGQKDARCDHSNVASVVFNSPAVAVVGLSEQAAVEKLKNVQVFSSKFT